jgi:hypothetical protein
MGLKSVISYFEELSVGLEASLPPIKSFLTIFDQIFFQLFFSKFVCT